MALPRKRPSCVSAMRDMPPQRTAAEAAPWAPRAKRRPRKVVASAKRRVARARPRRERRRERWEEVRAVRRPARGAKVIWQMSLEAKKMPRRTWALLLLLLLLPLWREVATPRGGGLVMRVWMMGRSIVSWSMSLKRAVVTRRTTSFCRRDRARRLALDWLPSRSLALLAPPRMAVTNFSDSLFVVLSGRNESAALELDMEHLPLKNPDFTVDSNEMSGFSRRSSALHCVT
mmetsp:Transcript_11028/g.23584  ORF Transcript_11028/g.23584 Transcript_11028/m.23584 type:complete len:231 (+) Transcript_11028:1038-1730(+)